MRRTPNIVSLLLAAVPASSLRREDDICRSHRIGAKSKPQPDGTVKHRPIIVRFIKYRDRRKVFGEKKKLRGSEFIFREDLTKARLDVYRRAVAILGLKKMWTLDGRTVYID
ncbi:hypothetical protein J6590_075274 [Homalodisca vitripennis]|nr:hypothetical protein J6590_075274 [Homalodisca vitripennis]